MSVRASTRARPAELRDSLRRPAPCTRPLPLRNRSTRGAFGPTGPSQPPAACGDDDSGKQTTMAVPLLSHADAAVGNAIEAAVTLKHRRRLRRLGWERALDPPDDGLWAAGDPPPREGCALEVLVDGAQALPAIAEAHARTRATSSTSPAGTSRRTSSSCAGEPPVVARRAAGRAGRAHRRPRAGVGRRAGAGLPPDALARSARPCARSRAARASAAEIDPREHPFHCHHEKTIASTASWPSSTASTSPTTPATASTRASTRPAGAWAGTTSAPGCAAPRWPTSTTTSRGAGTR